ncbi:unnamed protein product [Arctia plantaginis]|uniref:Uncharacterized protein n=1 Tax=Arctia plantaginis TaxID=874455 RepID=A0A8S1B5G7_ARCPL|nr:unnamed protein product [Arctia plantaginis]
MVRTAGRKLSTSSHVFLRRGQACRSLEPPYSGPHKVIARADKTFDIEVQGKVITVSIDRIKPAFTVREEASSPIAPIAPPAPIAPAPVVAPPAPFAPSAPPAPQPTPSSQPRTTRSGRRVHFPDYYHCRP